VELLKNKNVILISLKENLNTSTPQGRFMLTVFAGLAELERETILERQREGIALAKQQGKYKGRKKIGFPDNWSEVYDQWKHRQITGTHAMTLLNLKRNTFYNLLKEYEEKSA
jgi:DNA invertase Pin-like site-specific DNA recombinase